MRKEILAFGNIEIEKRNKNKIKNFATQDYYFFFNYVDIEQILVSKKISFGEKTKDTLLDTCIMIIKLSHYI